MRVRTSSPGTSNNMGEAGVKSVGGGSDPGEQTSPATGEGEGQGAEPCTPFHAPGGTCPVKMRGTPACQLVGVSFPREVLASGAEPTGTTPQPTLGHGQLRKGGIQQACTGRAAPEASLALAAAVKVGTQPHRHKAEDRMTPRSQCSAGQQASTGGDLPLACVHPD